MSWTHYDLQTVENIKIDMKSHWFKICPTVHAVETASVDEMTSGLSACQFIDPSSGLVNQYLHCSSFMATETTSWKLCLSYSFICNFDGITNARSECLCWGEFVISWVTQHIWPCRGVVICFSLVVCNKDVSIYRLSSIWYWPSATRTGNQKWGRQHIENKHSN